MGLVEKRLQNSIDEKTLDIKRLTHDVVTKSLEAVKYDYEQLINKLGASLQDLLTKLKQEQSTALT
jgi:hypothetical protein